MNSKFTFNHNQQQQEFLSSSQITNERHLFHDSQQKWCQLCNKLIKKEKLIDTCKEHPLIPFQTHLNTQIEEYSSLSSAYNFYFSQLSGEIPLKKHQFEYFFQQFQSLKVQIEGISTGYQNLIKHDIQPVNKVYSYDRIQDAILDNTLKYEKDTLQKNIEKLQDFTVQIIQIKNNMQNIIQNILAMVQSFDNTLLIYQNYEKGIFKHTDSLKNVPSKKTSQNLFPQNFLQIYQQERQSSIHGTIPKLETIEQELPHLQQMGNPPQTSQTFLQSNIDPLQNCNELMIQKKQRVSQGNMVENLNMFQSQNNKLSPIAQLSIKSPAIDSEFSQNHLKAEVKNKKKETLVQYTKTPGFKWYWYGKLAKTLNYGNKAIKTYLQSYEKLDRKCEFEKFIKSRFEDNEQILRLKVQICGKMIEAIKSDNTWANLKCMSKENELNIFKDEVAELLSESISQGRKQIKRLKDE